MDLEQKDTCSNKTLSETLKKMDPDVLANILTTNKKRSLNESEEDDDHDGIERSKKPRSGKKSYDEDIQINNY